ncbi:hypothetical protein [Pectobacterium brasiliense]|uniref:hypothetical protein n=1 Tax=Pectobacterium brasiliense TaxID=180957 RepID=UPI0019698476|nr:hypothetical protein [Pectobacterium brasiliense]MBN3262972.1 hypothetical protein [Pectobacterium brasiliense]
MKKQAGFQRRYVRCANSFAGAEKQKEGESMKSTSISAQAVAAIFNKAGAYINGRSAVDVANSCNEKAGDSGRDAEAWARYYAEEEAYQQECEAIERGSDD